MPVIYLLRQLKQGTGREIVSGRIKIESDGEGRQFQSFLLGNNICSIAVMVRIKATGFKQQGRQRVCLGLLPESTHNSPEKEGNQALLGSNIGSVGQNQEDRDAKQGSG